MSEPRVTELRSIEFDVTDAATSARFYETCWGLTPVSQQDGVHYLRATGAEHHIVALREGPKARVRSVNFAAPDKVMVDGIHSKGRGVALIDILVVENLWNQSRPIADLGQRLATVEIIIHGAGRLLDEFLK